MNTCLTLLVIGWLKLWALFWLYGFMGKWIQTGATPSFWSFALAVFLTMLVFSPVRVDGK